MLLLCDVFVYTPSCVYCMSVCVYQGGRASNTFPGLFACTRLVEMEWYTVTQCSPSSDVILHDECGFSFCVLHMIMCLPEYYNRAVASENTILNMQHTYLICSCFPGRPIATCTSGCNKTSLLVSLQLVKSVSHIRYEGKRAIILTN